MVAPQNPIFLILKIHLPHVSKILGKMKGLFLFYEVYRVNNVEHKN